MTVSIISITFILAPFVFLLGWYMETNYRHLSRRMKGKPESPVVWCWVKDIALGFLISIAPWFILLFAALIILSIGDEPLLASLWPPIAGVFYYFYLRLFIKHYNSVHPNGWMAILSNKVANKLAPHKSTIKKWSFRLINRHGNNRQHYGVSCRQAFCQWNECCTRYGRSSSELYG